MAEPLLGALRRALKVPPRPEPPAGSADSTRVFRAARGFYYRQLVEWGLKQWGAFLGIYFGLAASDFVPSRIDAFVGGWIRSVETVAIALFVLQLAVSFVAVGLGYRLRWYIVTDRSLRIREGIWRVREQTVSFANIQNVAVRQGPLQRLLGIADVEIRTAGGGASGDDSDKSDDLHRAVFRGVDNAHEIRDLIRNDLRRLEGRSGRDPSTAASAETEIEPTTPAEPPKTLLAASRELADAARSLRASLAESPEI